jgi:phosphoribosyl 1,2-cyclic phosphodiesterase
MQIRLWGVRGSCPSPPSNEEYRAKLKSILQYSIEKNINNSNEIDDFINDLPENLQYFYGGNTTCVSVTSDSGKMYIIDGGTGIRPLGDELMKGSAGKGEGEITILMTHYHWDHIQGLPFFKPIYIPGNVFHFISPYKDQEKYLVEQMRVPYFPATFEGTASVKKFTHLDPKDRKPFFLEDDLKVEYYPLKHPGGSFAYKFTQNGKSFIFATDAEFTGEALERTGNETDFFMDAELLVFDSQYTLDEAFLKFDWGHTGYTMAVNCGIRWNIKHLVMTHHEPAYTDEKLRENYSLALEHQGNSGNTTLEISLAREGKIFHL